MQKKDVLVIGGGPGGWMAALIAKKENKDIEVGLIRMEEKALIPCAIPYIFHKLGSADKNCLPDTPLEEAGIDIIKDKVESIDKENKIVHTKDNGDIGYDKLILALGSSPVEVPIPGRELENVYSIKKDYMYISALSEKLRNAKDVVIVGGGFIGIEFADELKKNGSNVTIVEMLPACLEAANDKEYCALAEEELEKIGIDIKTNKKVEKFEGEGRIEKVCLDDGVELKCDLAILAIGAKGNTSLAEEAGLEVSEYGITVDKYMQTSDPNIFAIGDCASKFSFFTGELSGIKLSSIAANEGRIAGANLSGQKKENKGAIGVYSTSLGEPAMCIGAAGLTEAAAEKAGIKYIIGQAEATDKHPGGMPDTRKMKLKLLFDKETKVLIGGQIAGGITTGEIINCISALIGAKKTMEDIILFQMGTQPINTPSPLAYPLNKAAEDAKYKNL